ncbi:MAG: ribonuclease III [Candidatus Cyclobacteriaceae bacterium M2_1C_046]
MAGAIRHFFKIFEKKSPADDDLISAIKNIVGKRPRNLNLYRLATSHTSIAKKNIHGLRESNERLEYLGDAILGAVVAEFLFKKYPFKDEGFLTEIRSRIVSRDSLNTLGRKVGVDAIVKFDQRKKEKTSHKSLYGDTLEALIGAVYLDRGYRFCRKFIIGKLINPHFNLKEIIKSERNFKSRIIEWAQKENKEVKFEIEIKAEKNHKEFTAQVFIDKVPFGTGYGLSKKKAEQDAAEKSFEMLNINGT